MNELRRIFFNSPAVLHLTGAIEQLIYYMVYIMDLQSAGKKMFKKYIEYVREPEAINNNCEIDSLYVERKRLISLGYKEEEADYIVGIYIVDSQSAGKKMLKKYLEYVREQGYLDFVKKLYVERKRLISLGYKEEEADYIVGGYILRLKGDKCLEDLENVIFSEKINNQGAEALNF